MSDATDPMTALCVGVLGVDAELRQLTEERDAARRLALSLAEKVAGLAAHLSRLAERPDRRDCR